MRPGKYLASVRQTGDISRGAGSTGGVWDDRPTTHNGPGSKDREQRGRIGSLEVVGTGKGSLFVEKEVEIWEVVGRGFVVEREDGGREGDGVVVGVIARSAGVWENEKVVCSCSGKTVWEEREEQVGRGML